MTAPPFAVDVLLPGEGEDVLLDMVLEAEGEASMDADDYEGTDEVVTLFVAAVNEQLFSGGPMPLGTAIMKEVAKAWVSDAPRWHYQYRMRAVAPDAFLVLLALLTQTHYTFEPLRRVYLRATPLREPVDQHALLALRPDVPARRIEPPFHVDDEGADRRRNIRIAFEFKAPVSRKIFKQLEASLNIWDHLVMLSGFHLDFEEMDDLPPFGRTGHLSPTVVTHDLDWFDGYPSAFNALINLGHRWHTEGHRLAAFTIE